MFCHVFMSKENLLHCQVNSTLHKFLGCAMAEKGPASVSGHFSGIS